MTTRTKAIPEGFHTLTPHLIVKGASEAIEFYKKAFGAEEIIRLPGPDGKSIMHAALKIGDSRLFLVDEFPQMGSLWGPTALVEHLSLYMSMSKTWTRFSIRQWLPGPKSACPWKMHSGAIDMDSWLTPSDTNGRWHLIKRT